MIIINCISNWCLARQSQGGKALLDCHVEAAEALTESTRELDQLGRPPPPPFLHPVLWILPFPPPWIKLFIGLVVGLPEFCWSSIPTCGIPHPNICGSLHVWIREWHPLHVIEVTQEASQLNWTNLGSCVAEVWSAGLRRAGLFRSTSATDHAVSRCRLAKTMNESNSS